MARPMAWYDYHITQGFKWTPEHTNWHSGIDLGVPWNTPVTAALSGRVVFAQCKPWGGQVDILTTWQDSSDRTPHPYVVTVLHLHKITVATGDSVVAGQLLGYSGGDERGPCPTDMKKYSNGPHVHFELTLGTLGPYHGGPPYKFGRNSHTVNPAYLLAYIRGQIELQPPTPIDPGAGSEPAALPAIDALFAIPQATTELLDAIPGVDNLIYRLHEAETFPGWKTVDQVAPLGNIPDINVNAAGVSVRIPLGWIERIGPGRIAYWLIGNLWGNARAAVVRFVFLTAGFMLLAALLIALGLAQIETNGEDASKVVQAVAPLVEGAAEVA